MNERILHRQLYREIPEMKCIAGCTDCCGPVPVSEYEAKRLGIPGPLTPVNENLKCVFATPQGCSVYDRRPLMCRLFGTVQKLPCPHGAKPAGLLSPQKEFVILTRYQAQPSLQELNKRLPAPRHD